MSCPGCEREKEWKDFAEFGRPEEGEVAPLPHWLDKRQHTWVLGECSHASADGAEDIFPDDSHGPDEMENEGGRVWPDDFKNFGSNVFGRRFGRG